MKDYDVYTLKSGREIQAPKPALKKNQRKLLTHFHTVKIHECVHGGVKGRSVLSAVAAHLDAQLILKVDIKSFFENTTEWKILDALCKYPMSIKSKRHIVNNLDLCMFTKTLSRVLPTGAPTSVFLANVAARPVDAKVLELIKEYETTFNVKISYTRYIDDLTLSLSNKFHNSFQEMFLDDIQNVITSTGYTINKKKTKWMERGKDNMEILGVSQTPEGKPQINRKFRKRLRSILYSSAKIGTSPPPEVWAQLNHVKRINKDQYDKLVLHYKKNLPKDKNYSAFIY